MRDKFNLFVAHPFGKLLLIELIIFTVMALLSIVLSFTYSTGLMILGVIMMTLRFTSSGSSAPGISRGAFIYEINSQYIRDLKDPNQMKQRMALMNDLLIIGFIPFAVGVALSLMRY